MRSKEISVQYEIEVIQGDSEGRVLDLEVEGMPLNVHRKTFHYTKDVSTGKFQRMPEEWFYGKKPVDSFASAVRWALDYSPDDFSAPIAEGDVFHCEFEGKNYTWVAGKNRTFSVGEILNLLGK
jgi:hypothetical protein